MKKHVGVLMGLVLGALISCGGGGSIANEPPVVAKAAAASSSAVTGTTTVLSALGADDGGEASLTYTWATMGTPPATVTYDRNGTNNSQSTTATFIKAGVYTFLVTIQDAQSLSVTSSISVTVNATLTSVMVTPSSASVTIGGPQRFGASAQDQFGTVLANQPTFTWTVSGGGNIDNAGLFTAGTSTGGPYTVTASGGGISGTASVRVMSASSRTFYIAPVPSGSDANGDGSNNNPWATLSMAFCSMSAGDTLICKDGTYTGMKNQITNNNHPPIGFPAAWTIVVAEHDGKAVFDGEYLRDMFSINLSADLYWRFEGLLWGKPAGSTVGCIGRYVKFMRCGAFDAGNGNTSNFYIGRESSYVLLEDCFAWGAGRYKFSCHTMSGHDEGYIVFRRCVGRLDRANTSHDDRMEPVAVFSVYASENVEVQNCIAIDSDHPEFWISNEIAGAFYVPSTDGPAISNYFRGNIALNVDMSPGNLTKNLTDISFENFVGWHLREGVYARDSARYDFCTFGNFYGPSRFAVTGGFCYSEGDDPINTTSITNSILMNIQGTALNKWSVEDYNIFYNNTANVINMSAGAHTINQNPNLRYLIRPEAGNDKGATILKQIGVSGTLYGEPGYKTLTNENLWPFPNEKIIKELFKAYSYMGPTVSGTTGNLSGNRGFCADGKQLDGVHDITLTSYVWEYLGNPIPPKIYGY